MTDILDALKDTTRANIVQNILGHPQGAPSLDEINYYNPATDKDEIRDHLDELVDAGVVIPLEPPETKQKEDRPDTFFVLSEKVWETLNRHDILVDELDEIRSDHTKVEKTERIERYENAPRPDLPSNAHESR